MDNTFSNQPKSGSFDEIVSLITPAIDSLSQQSITTSIVLNALLNVLKEHNVITDEEMQAEIDVIQQEFKKSIEAMKTAQNQSNIITPDDIKKKLK